MAFYGIIWNPTTSKVIYKRLFQKAVSEKQAIIWAWYVAARDAGYIRDNMSPKEKHNGIARYKKMNFDLEATAKPFQLPVTQKPELPIRKPEQLQFKFESLTPIELAKLISEDITRNNGRAS